MEIQKKEVPANGMRFYIDKERKEVAHAYLYLLGDDSSTGVFGFIHNFYVDSFADEEDYGFILMQKIIEEAKEAGCYKLVSAKRHDSGKRMQKLYEKIGFKGFGLEFRMDFY